MAQACCEGHPRLRNPSQLKKFVKKNLSHFQRLQIYRVLRVLDRAPLPLGPTIYREVRILPWRFTPPIEAR
jgi:hypothetical protein